MKKLNPIERSEYINERYKEYLKSSFELGHSDLQRLFVEQLEKERLFKGPYVDMIFPFQRGHNLDYLIENGVLCKSFRILKDIDFLRPLYSHQEEALELIKGGRSAVITTGTGSGKTECFLYPILNDLLCDVEKGNIDVGIRAIFLYPMNVLVNDQVDRIRKMLGSCPEITFGFFTGDTPERASANDRIRLSKENNIEIRDNELISREEIRENPPHLLFTNYSMLEHLLIRPDDYALFEPARLKNWKYVVLDEAHSYRGSKGIEISYLLRRLTGLAHKRPQFILTSATLGKQGESEEDIVRFANSLTSADFSDSDIIFSKRIPLRGSPEYRIKGADYTAIKNVAGELREINDITTKYYSSVSSNTSELLYDLLIRDENVHDLSSLLSNGSRDFLIIQDKMREYVTQEELVDLIDLINVAEKDSIGLFDLKYHSFVRPLSGAYITYGEVPKLSLTKANEIDGMKAFEIGNCRFCNSPYIIGKIHKNNQDQMDYLLQNEEIDIYENYGSEDFVQIDYFLLEDAVIEDDEEIEAEIEKDSIEAYEICAKCGEIHSVDDLNAKKCECGEDYHFVAYKVVQGKKKTEDSVKNNITRCPYCGNEKRAGVIKALNIGKDDGTVLIGQLLYDAIDEGEEDVKMPTEQSLNDISAMSNGTRKEHVKQFLAFSDSRQQASYAAAYYDDNHVSMLRKRLIWEMIKNNDYASMKVDELVASLGKRIEAEDLFQNDMDAYKNAWAAVLVDLLRVDGSYDGEGLGLYHFDLDVKNIIDDYSEDEIAEAKAFAGCNMTKEKLYTFIQLAMRVFKNAPAINYAKSRLDVNETEKILGYKRYNNSVMLQKQLRSANSKDDNSSYVRSFLPVYRANEDWTKNKDKTNMVVRYTMKAFNIDADAAKQALELVFRILERAKVKFFTGNMKRGTYQIDANRYVVNNYMNSKYYQCNKCGTLTPYNIDNACVRDKCMGRLLEIDPDEVLATNYYRQQYKNKKIERVKIREHTAQLDRKLAKEYQLEFMNREINILSSSTTFELGVDLGSLETVFMRNIPPTPANYVQRAGRAGRRKESAAYILTYCAMTSHDYTYFSEPEKMISGQIDPPYFNILNRKIISRHLMATSLGFFFRNNQEYFQSIGAFVFNGGIDAFRKYMDSKPENLNDYINNKILPEPEFEEYRNFKWFDEMGGEDENLNRFISKMNDMRDEFNNAIDEARNKAASGDVAASEAATYYMKQINYLNDKELLDSLSKYRVIPKYSFPIDVVELQIYNNGVPVNQDDDKYALSRDLKIAISEYAPDSEVIVDNNKYVSKYITLKRNAVFPNNWFVTCSNCKKINIFLSEGDKNCRYCGEPISTNRDYFIEPIYGFKAVKAMGSARRKPKRSYAGEVSYVGHGMVDGQRLVLGLALEVETSSDDELLIMNKSGFFMCPVCGYSDIVKSGLRPPQIFKKHKNYRQDNCSCEKLDYLRLGHRFKTDVARFIIPSLSSRDKMGYPQALSFLYAFLEGVSIALGIERRDIDGILEMNLECQSYDILLYDKVPGGAGHVKRLLNKDAIIRSLRVGLNKISAECCNENTSCYNCLRNYNNQSYHNLLRRKLAIDVIEVLLFEIMDTNETFQNEHWSRDVRFPKRMKLTLGNDGRNPGNETADDIWSDLLDDCYDDDEISLIKIIKENSPKNIARPYYRKTVKIEETGEEFLANLLWDSKKVMLFLNETYDDYLIAKQTGWNVFCTKEGFDVQELFEKVGE